MSIPRALPLLCLAFFLAGPWFMVPSQGADRGMPAPRQTAAAPASPDKADRLAAEEIQRLNESDTGRRLRRFAEMVLLPCGVVLLLVLVVRRGFLQ